MERSRILVVDDDPLIRGSLYELLRGRRYDVEMAADGDEAMNQLRRRSYHLVITDWKMPQVNGMSLLEHIRSRYPDVGVVIITGFGTINSAVEAIQQGAFDYLTKPIQPDELEDTIQRALSQYTPPTGTLEDPFESIITQDPGMQKLFSMIRSVAETPATVLIEGESGTGKRLIAQAIHRADPKRNQKPFVEISCGALPESLLESELFGHVRGAFTGAVRDKQGRFEVAEGGTILLDEIDAFSPALQVKLLRVIQERLYERVGDTRTLRADVRIVAATNQTLSELVKRGQFRGDLFYRLNVIALRLPPLRDRRGDVPLLVTHFLEHYCKAIGKTLAGISEDALRVLTEYRWPGNIRELENIMERAVIFAQHARIDVEDLPDEVRFHSDATSMAVEDREEEARAAEGEADGPAALKDALRLPERDIILKVLEEVRWNRSEAAKRLGIHRSTLYHKLRQLGIDPSSR